MGAGKTRKKLNTKGSRASGGGGGSGDMIKAVYDPANLQSQVLTVPIELTADEFKALIDTPAGILNGQLYHVTQTGGDVYQLPLSIIGMYITGGNAEFLSGVLALISITGRYESATYYTLDNTIFQNNTATISIDIAQAYFTGNDIQSSFVIVNTDYIIDNSGATQLPTGISRIKGRAVLDPSGNVVWDKANCEAWVTALATYVPCTYDVGTNTISGSYILYAANISQIGASAPVVDLELVNIMGETPTFGYSGNAGEYRLDIVASLFPENKTRTYFNMINSSNATSIVNGISVFAFRDSNTRMVVASGTILTNNADDLLNNTYIEVKVNF